MVYVLMDTIAKTRRNWKNIRIHLECEGGMEKSVAMITVWQTMTNGEHEARIFYPPTLTQIMDSFSWSS